MHSQPVPFWRRPGAIALYPLRGAALVTLILLTVLGMLGWLPSSGWIFSIIVYFAGYKYAFEILLRTANGDDRPPEVSIEAQNGAVWRIQLGPFADKAQASAVQQRLQSEAQLQSFITRAN